MNQTAETQAPPGHQTSTAGSLMESWLEAALELAANFPPGQISIARRQRDAAIARLDEVKAELTNVGPKIVEYFETSRPRYEYTLALALDQPGGRVLDLGCSPGHLSMALVKAGFEVQGVDLNPVWLEK